MPGANQRFALELPLRAEHYPFWSMGRLTSVAQVDVYARSSKAATPASLDIFDRRGTTDAATKKDALTKDQSMGDLLVGRLTNIALPASPEGTLKLFFDDNQIGDLWIAVTWSGA